VVERHALCLAALLLATSLPALAAPVSPYKLRLPAIPISIPH